MTSENSDVKVGQVYRDKDSRKTRYIKVGPRDEKFGAPAFWSDPCDSTGKLLGYEGRGKNGHRHTRIRATILQTRFELIKDVQGD